MRIQALIACAAFACAAAAQAQPARIDTRTFLGEPGFTAIDLKEDNGRTIGRLDRPTLQRMVDVTSRIVKAYGMQEPQILVALSRSPSASAAWYYGHLRVEITPMMLTLAGGDPDMLAAVVAHALAHVQAAHTNADYSREQEMEADRLALRAMADAGFDPRGAAEFWQMIQTHPRALWNDAHPWYPEREKVLASAAAAAPVAAKPAQAGTSATDAKSLGALALKSVTGEGGVAKDYARARTYAERAAEGGDLLGLAVLGALMRDGIAGPANPQRGIGYLEKAAQGGNAWAHYQLGLSYERGLGVAPDREKALAHYKVAAPEVQEAAQRAAAIAK